MKKVKRIIGTFEMSTTGTDLQLLGKHTFVLLLIKYSAGPFMSTSFEIGEVSGPCLQCDPLTE